MPHNVDMNIPSDDRGIETDRNTGLHPDLDNDGIIEDALGSDAAPEEVGSD